MYSPILAASGIARNCASQVCVEGPWADTAEVTRTERRGNRDEQATHSGSRDRRDYSTRNAMIATIVGTSAPTKSHMGESSRRRTAEQRLPCRVWRVGDHGQPAAGHRTLDNRHAQRLVELRDQRGQVRDERVVVERREEGRRVKQRLPAQAAQHRRNPPRLQAPVYHQPAEEEADQQRGLQLDAALVRGGRLGEAQEDQEAADEERRVVRVDHRPCHEQQVDPYQPRRNRQQAMGASAPSSSGCSTSCAGARRERAANSWRNAKK